MTNLMKVLTLTLIVGVWTNVPMAVTAQDIRASLFAEADKALQQMNEVNASMLSPENYQKGLTRYQNAARALKRGDNLQSIREQLEEAVRYFDQAYETVKLAEVTFASTLSARNDAFDAEAVQFAPEEWRNAEREFSRATRELEDGDSGDAKRRGNSAEELYRRAELIAIETNILAKARDLLKESDRRKHNAPNTLNEARQLVEKAENLLENSRYDTDEARTIAKKAEYQARHAIFLDNYIERLDEEDKSREEVILALEDELKKVADALQVSAQFDQGYDRVTNDLTNKIASLNDSLYEQDQRYHALEAEKTELMVKLDSVTKERSEITQRVESLSQFLGRFTTISNLFTKEEARVIRDQDNAVIRLVGFSFDVGSSVIKPEYFGLLTKVQRAIRTFPDSKVFIEGHTDSQGGDDVNLRLSQERANAVRSYLLANMDIEPSRLQATGYGESKPIANNETEQGRKQNRRIDIVIEPNNKTIAIDE